MADRATALMSLLFLLASAGRAGDTPPQSPGDLAEASLETLMNLEVSSPARKEQRLSQTAGAVVCDYAGRHPALGGE